MKKLLVLAMMATLLMAGSALAVDRHLTPVPNATFSFGSPGVASGPATTNNDDSCDIGVAPAATLLLPYFEVDFTNRTQDTLFTITNVSRLPQIAHVSVWTDWSFPVLDFNIYLTGYDVQGISMNQVLGGLVAQQVGTGPTVLQTQPTGVGALSAGFTANPNFAGGGTAINCASQPGPLNAALVTAVRSALTTGVYNPPGGGCATAVGGVHANAIGYVTVDVASNCSLALPSDPNYYNSSILYDNVLIGDYQQLGPAAGGTVATSFDAGGNAMVHIRAVPEGGPAGSLANIPTNLPFTFYDRYTNVPGGGQIRTIDRRQPLPSLWAARYIQSPPGAASAFATNYKIWREGYGNGTCVAGIHGNVLNGSLPVAEIVRFDEHENPNTALPCIQSPCPTSQTVTLPETSAQNTTNGNFPTISSPVGDVGGWMYLNLNNLGQNSAGGAETTGYSVTRNNGIGGVVSVTTLPSGLQPPGTVMVRPSQNWVVIEMFGNGPSGNRLTVDFDAAWLGNGCSQNPGVGRSVDGSTGAVIGPAGGVLVCPAPLVPGGAGCTPTASFQGTNNTFLP
jgi:hypothetical protein